MTRLLIDRPPWLKKKLVINGLAAETSGTISGDHLNTVCSSSLCPNQNECLSKGQATFLLLGNRCTRSCAFCNCRADLSMPEMRNLPIDPSEPKKIASAVNSLGLKYVVITSVTRDDLEDGGSSQFARTLEEIKKNSDEIKAEVLVPDFKGGRKAIEIVVRASPDVFGHNIETVERLYRQARVEADYDRSLGLLRYVKKIRPNQLTKSSIMVGLGEEEEEVFSAMKDLRGAGCDMLTIGQYLRPRQDNLPVSKYIPPQEFDRYRDAALKLGFRSVLSGPFVRSSYLAEETYYKTIGGYHDGS